MMACSPSSCTHTPTSQSASPRRCVVLFAIHVRARTQLSCSANQGWAQFIAHPLTRSPAPEEALIADPALAHRPALAAERLCCHLISANSELSVVGSAPKQELQPNSMEEGRVG